MDNRPIGIFDSGLGGLTILSELLNILPNENYIYFGDTARVPYGSKSKETIIEYSRQIVRFLITQNVKAIIIACGTASSLAFEALKKEFNIPIIDVITPTIKSLNSKKVGVIATSATIKSGIWKKQITKKNKETIVISKACPLFVPIVEEGLVDNEIADNAISLYLKDMRSKKVDSLILGCTHYPILIDKIKNYMPKETKIINMNKYCALYTKNYLKSHKLLKTTSKNISLVAYTTDNTAGFKKNSKNFCNIKFDKVSRINITKY